MAGRNQLHKELLRCQVNAPEHPLLSHGTTVGVAWLSACDQSHRWPLCAPGCRQAAAGGAVLQSTDPKNYGRRCLTPLSPHRNYILS